MTGRVWRGCAFGGVKGRSQLPGLVDDYLAGRLKVDEFITHRRKLVDINGAFELMHSGDCIRTVVDIHGKSTLNPGCRGGGGSSRGLFPNLYLGRCPSSLPSPPTSSLRVPYQPGIVLLSSLSDAYSQTSGGKVRSKLPYSNELWVGSRMNSRAYAREPCLLRGGRLYGCILQKCTSVANFAKSVRLAVKP